MEETAGVVKYRERKKEALRKISSANDNLLRLADIMTEIESRLGPLERDAENAKKYLELKKEKDDLSIGILAENTLEAKEKLEKITAESDEIRENPVRFPLLFWRKKYLWIKKILHYPKWPILFNPNSRSIMN